MRTTSRLTLSVIAGAAMLSACGGSQPPIAATDSISRPAATQKKTFTYTGKRQTFIVPIGVTQITVAASGAGSPSYSEGPSGPSSMGSDGGFVQATIPVTAGEKLAIFVGGEGGVSDGGFGGPGGFNGGGTGGQGDNHSSYVNGGVGGGSASDIREGGSKLANRVLVAAGGGGVKVGYPAGAGGAGGGRVGGDGGGGGGGSSYVEPSATHVKNVQGGAGAGNGKIVISW